MTASPLNKLYVEAAARASAPQVDVQAVLPLSRGTLKVVAAVRDVTNEDAFGTEIARMTDGRGRLVPGSFHRRDHVAVGVVTANAQSRPMDASFTMVTASTAVDPAGTIWRVEAEGDGKRVVLESADDLPAIFSDRMARRHVTLNPVEGRGVATASFGNGDLVRYVDVATLVTECGLVFLTEAGATVVSLEVSPRPVAVDRVAIVAATPRARLPAAVAGVVTPMEATAKLSPDKMNKIIAYLSKAYGPASGPMLDRLRQIAAGKA